MGVSVKLKIFEKGDECEAKNISKNIDLERPSRKYVQSFLRDL